MEDVAIIYSSKLGSSKAYAEEIQARTGGRLVEAKNFQGKTCKEGVVIFCAPIYAMGLLNRGLLKRNMAYLEGKKVAVFCVGASPYDPEEFYRIYRHHLDGPLKDVPAFYGRGLWDQDRLGRVDKLIINLAYRKIRSKKPGDLTGWEKEFLALYGHKKTWVNPRYVDPLIHWIGAKDPFDD